MSKKTSSPQRQRSVEAVATFAAMMHAYERGELAVAAQARRDLERLGVAIQRVRPEAQRDVGGDGNG